MAEILQNPPPTAQISVTDPQKVEVNLYWTESIDADTFNIYIGRLPRLEAHHFWNGRIIINYDLLTLDFRMDAYRKRTSGRGNTPFKAKVECYFYVDNVLKVTGIKEDQWMCNKYDTTSFSTHFEWLTEQVLNPVVPGTPQNLKIHFKVTYPKRHDWPESQDEAEEVVPSSNPQFTFEDFVFSPELSDLDILTDTGEVIKAHKIILAGKSPVFARMFLGPFVESKDSRVAIDDFTGEIVKLMLRFIYTGKVGSKDLEDVMQLLEIADKYGILELKDQCAAEIKDQLKMDNLMEMLRMVFEGMLQNSKEILTKFIVKNLEESKKMDDFKVFMRGERAFAAELFVAELEMARKARNVIVKQEDN